MHPFQLAFHLLISFHVATLGDYDVVPEQDVWQYDDTNTNQISTGYQAPSFPASNWLSGAGVLGYNFPDLTTQVSFGPVDTAKYVTTYFRKAVSVYDEATLAAPISFTVTFAHGVRCFLNGIEVLRRNLPTGMLAHTTRATVAVSNTSASSLLYTAVTSVEKLSLGLNVLACDVHLLSSSTSKGMRFDLSMSAIGVSAPTPTVTPTATESATVTSSVSATATSTGSFTATGSGTATTSGTVTATASASGSGTTTATVSATPTATATTSGTVSATVSMSATSSDTCTGTSSGTTSASASQTVTGTQTISPTQSASATVSVTPSYTASGTESTSESGSLTSSATNTVTASASASTTQSSSESSTPSSSFTATGSAMSSLTGSVSSTISGTDTTTATTTATSTVTVSPTFSWSPSATCTSSTTVTNTGTVTGTVSPSGTLSFSVTPSTSSTTSSTMSSTASATRSLSMSDSATGTESATGSGTRTTTTSPTQSTSPTQLLADTNSSASSSNAKRSLMVGVGLGVGLGVIFVAIAAFVLSRNPKKAANTQAPSADGGRSEKSAERHAVPADTAHTSGSGLGVVYAAEGPVQAVIPSEQRCRRRRRHRHSHKRTHHSSDAHTSDANADSEGARTSGFAAQAADEAGEQALPVQPCQDPPPLPSGRVSEVIAAILMADARQPEQSSNITHPRGPFSSSAEVLHDAPTQAIVNSITVAEEEHGNSLSGENQMPISHSMLVEEVRQPSPQP